jgi:predicted permease
MSLRSALGADRPRLVRQVLLESTVLSLLGGAGGSAIAWFAMSAASRAAPSDLRHIVTPAVNLPVLGMAILLSLVAAGAAGLAPALRASHVNAGQTLREGRGASSGRERRRGQRMLVVAEVALTMVLLVASGMFLRSFRAQLQADPGFEAAGIATFSVMLPAGRFEEPEQMQAFRDDAKRALAALPGVRDLTITTTTPLGGGGMELVRAFLRLGAPEPPAGPEHAAQWVEADEDYFRTLGMRPLRGRAFTRDDGPDSEPVMIVTEGMAEALAPGGDVIGMRVRSWRDENLYRTVVGVVPRPRISDIGDNTLPVVFVPAAQAPRRQATFLLRADGEPTAMAPGIRRVMAELDPNIAVPEVASLEMVQRRGLAPLRFLVGLFSAFGAVALLLAVTGVYGLVSFSVATRTREIGIRMAVGATGGNVRAAVLREGLGLALLGLGIGALAAAAFARLVGSVLVDMAWLDVPTWGAVLALLGLAATVATLVPALRASRIDPVRTLGAE